MAKKRFNAVLDEEVIQRMKIQALKEGLDVSVILERLIREYLAQVEPHGR